MGRRVESPSPSSGPGAADVLRARFRALDNGLLPATDDPEAAARLDAIREQLLRDAAKLDDPAERLAIAETAYLSVFQTLPAAPASRERIH